MSGIAGIFHLDGRPADPRLLERMTGLMTHRGPDGIRHWTGGPVGLSHCALHTTSESLNGSQPLVDETAGLCLTFDGRVDNREELTAALAARGTKLHGDSDAEIVLRAYQVWGEELPAHILGDFAFALWDEARHQLVCARDPFRTKPFYYAFFQQTFILASEMQPLFEVPGLQRQPNLPLMAVYLLRHYDEQEETLYSGVYRLRPAHCLIVGEQGVRKLRYWDIDPGREIRYASDADYAEHFLQLFRQSVLARLRSRGPVAATLSGGLDSSSIVCTAQMLYREKGIQDNGFESFSILFDNYSSCDERDYSQAVVSKCGVKANFLTYEQHAEPWTNLETVYQYPDTFYGPALFMFVPALEAMRQKGMRVVLDGQGGDELLAAGFGHLADVARQASLPELIRTLRHTGNIYSVSPWRLFLNHCVAPAIPPAVKRVLRPMVRPLFRQTLPQVVERRFLESPEVRDRLHTAVKVTKMPTASQQAIYNSLFFGWNATVAVDMTELVTARFSLERRHPFFDRPLVEFLIAIPEEQRWRGDWAKIVLRHAMQGILPEAVQWRKRKAEFTGPIIRELTQRQAAKVQDIFSHSALDSLGIIDALRLRQFFERYKQQPTPYWTGNMELLIGLELWCRMNLGPVLH